jgi:iron complex outermembrane receptor protein
VLWIALAVNALLFLVEVVAGASADSSALHADALDFLADTANYGISLFALGAALRVRAGAALVKGLSMGAFGLWVVGRAAYQALTGTVPTPEIMGAVGVLALVANLGVAALLYAHRHGDSNKRSAWLCTRNDAIGNMAVVLAASGVVATGHGWPDVVVALSMAALSLSAAVQTVRQARGEMRQSPRGTREEDRIGRAGPTQRAPRARATRTLLLTLTLASTRALFPISSAAAQLPAQRAIAADTLATLRIFVRQADQPRDTVPLEGVVVRSGRVAAPSDAAGTATLRLAPGPHAIISTRIGFRPDTTRLTLRTSQDTSITVQLAEHAAALEAMVVTSTRGERRVEDTPLRVEVIDEEEIAEKVAMTPGDIAMMLNETSGLRVQATNPSLGGANVRIQGLRGRYSLILADGLPLYGGQAGGLGLLQIPPVDLGRVEVIKGTASALYGSSALGGVIDLVSRRPGEEHDGTALVNQTTRGGTDGVVFLAGPMAERWGYTLLAGAHRQRRNDLDDDGWTDMPGYERAVVRPRFYFDDGRGRTTFLTSGFTAEDRTGGTLGGGTVAGGGPYAEALRTRRADVGGLARWVVADTGSLAGIRALHGSILTVRGSAMEQWHGHRFGSVREDDRHRTWFAEAALAVPRGRVTYIAGAAFQQELYRNDDVAGFDYTYTIPAAFAQLDVDAATWLSISTSARLDAHSVYGTFVNPRVSLLLRRPPEGALAGWTARLSAGTGAFAPTPFTEETEATGLTPLEPLEGLVAERAQSASLDVGGPIPTALGMLELNATAFGSRVRHPLQVRDAAGMTADGARRITLANAPGSTHTWGGELLARLVHELGEGEDAPALRVTATYTYLRATECNPDLLDDDAGDGSCARREVPLTPRHAAGVVASIEEEGKSRLGVELYYTGRQALENNPYRVESRPYLILGLLGERAVDTRVGVARLFLNLENITGVRQTSYDPLLLPARGPGGRWTTDAWTELTGFTLNGGVRLGL